jgi:CHASE3 domain sensor protein
LRYPNERIYCIGTLPDAMMRTHEFIEESPPARNVLGDCVDSSISKRVCCICSWFNRGLSVHKPLSFARKIAFGYLAAGGLALLIGVIAIHSLRNIAADKDRLITVYGENLVNAATLESLCERTIAANRGYLLTGDASHLETAGKSDDEYEHVFDQLSQCTRTTADAAALDRIAVLRSSYERSIEKVLQGRIAGRTMDELSALMIADAVPRARALRTAITDFIEVEKSQMDAAQVASARTIGTIRIALVVLTIIAGGATVALGILFSRTLAQQLAMAIDAVRNSSRPQPTGKTTTPANSWRP